MTLRFFGRASKATAKKSPVIEQEPEPEEASTTPRRTRRGRRGSGATKKAAKAAAETTQKTAVVDRPATSSRSRATTRGSAGKKPPGNYLDSKAVPDHVGGEPTPIRQGPASPSAAGTVEGLLARQEALIEQQLATLKGVESALTAIEARLAHTPALGGERQRVGVFVDVPNIMYAAERLRTKIDYAKMLGFLLHGRELVRASAYSPISDDLTEPMATQKFVQPFIGLGYAMITKPLKRYGDGTIKANFDVELAIDILTICERLDVVILVSGDGDFRRLVELVCSKGVRVEVAAFGDSTAAELRSAADQYIDLEQHLTELRTK